MKFEKEKKHCINDEFHDVNRPLEITAFQLPNEFEEDYSEQKGNVIDVNCVVCLLIILKF